MNRAGLVLGEALSLAAPLTRPAADLSSRGDVKNSVSSRSPVRRDSALAFAPTRESDGLRGPGIVTFGEGSSDVRWYGRLNDRALSPNGLYTTPTVPLR